MQEPGVRCRHAAVTERPRGHGASPWRHRRPEIGADFLNKRQRPDAKVPDLRTRAGKTTAPCSNPPASRWAPTPTTTRPTRGVNFDGMLADAEGSRRRHRDRAARLLPQPHRLRPDRSPVGPGDRRGARHAAWWPSSTWPTKALAKASPKTAAVIGQFVAVRPELLRLHHLLQELLAVRRARRRPVAWSATDKEEAGRVLSQLKIVIRTNYSNPPTHGGAVVAVVLDHPSCAPSGKRAGRHAHAHQGHAPGPG